MKVSVVGTGYVGLVTGASLAETGNDVICIDADAEKIARLKRNEVPIYERELTALVERNQAAGRLQFTTDVRAGVLASKIIMIAVGTPPGEDGSADLRHVLEVARAIGDHMQQPRIVVTKSTVPVGTAAKVREIIASRTKVPFHVCSNPEFLKEGSAVGDFMKPERVVLGVDSPEAEEALLDLFAPFVRTGNPILVMDVVSAELCKYAANGMLAMRIAFVNQIAELCEKVGADISHVVRAVGSDKRIGPAFLFAGPGYGGSCFPKDVRALRATAREFGATPEILDAVDAANVRQKQVLARKVRRLLGGSATGATVAVWGLSFKAETDDIRESSSIDLIEALLSDKVKVKAHDPQSMPAIKRMFGDRICLVDEMYEAVRDADALVVVTEWLQYRNPDFDRIKSLMRRPILLDGRNLFRAARLRGLGFVYEGIGQGIPFAPK
jgi:UDPglucose 6-dehydrogenase